MKFQKENDERSESTGEHVHDFTRLVQGQITDAEGFRMLSFTETCFFCGVSREDAKRGTRQ